MKKILLFGGTGGLGTKLQEYLKDSFECISIGSKDCNVTNDEDVKNFVQNLDFDIVIYLSGPMSGIPEYNYPAFEAAALGLRARRFMVINPANNRPAVSNPTWRDYMEISLAQVQLADMVVVMKGWETSQGACLEVSEARSCYVEIVELDLLLSLGITWPLGEQKNKVKIPY